MNEELSRPWDTFYSEHELALATWIRAMDAKKWSCGFCGYTAVSYEAGTITADRGWPECKSCGAI